MSFEEAAAWPLVYETAYRMLVTRAGLRTGEWVLVWGVGGGVATAANSIARALGGRTIVTSGSDEKLAAVEADVKVNHTAQDVPEAVKEATGGHGADIVVEHVGEATWQQSLQAARTGGRVVVCGATSGPNPPAALHRIWWKQLSILGSTMGSRGELFDILSFVEQGRLKPVIADTMPIADARRGHEIIEKREGFGKVVLELA